MKMMAYFIETGGKLKGFEIQGKNGMKTEIFLTFLV